MSSYFPRCVASNQHAIYGLSVTTIGDSLHLVLARSSNNPTATFSEAWEIIAVSSFDDLDPNDDNLYGTLDGSECSVDNDGTFYLWARKNDEYDVFKFAKSSHSTISKSNKCRKKNPLFGQWSKTEINLLANVKYKRGMSVQDPRNTTGLATVVFHPHVEEALPPTAPATIMYAPTNTTWWDTNSSHYYPHMMSMVLTNTSAAIFNMVYGDNQMIALLKSPIVDDPTGRATGYVAYNKTLTYFPFPPNNLTSTARPVSVPWNVDCVDSEYWDENQARVANGKLYYMCKKTAAYIAPNNLYVYDTQTSKTQVVQLSNDTRYATSFTLAYGPSSLADPQFAVMFGSSSIVIDLFTLDQTGGPSISLIPYRLLPNSDNIYYFCGRPGDGLSFWEKVVIAVGVVAALMMMAWFFARWHRKRNAAKLVEEGEVVGVLPVYDDEMPSLSGERHIELAEMPRISEEHRVDAEGEAPPRYAPRS